MKGKHIFLFLILIVVFGLFQISDFSGDAVDTSFKSDNFSTLSELKGSFTSSNTSVSLEIADEPEEREDGLMNRSSLKSKSGMIFVYEKEDHRSFWMKNTYIPLDIIFLDSNRTVINIEQADPEPNTTNDEDLRSYESEEPAQYVVELNQGFAENNSIEPGDRLILDKEPVK